MSSLVTFLETALYMIFVQNLVFSGGYGSSEAIRMSAKPKRFVPFSIMITYFSTLTAFVCRLLDNIDAVDSLGLGFHTLIFGAVLVVIFIFTVLLCKILLSPNQKFYSTISIAALNTLVFAVPLINRQAGFSLIQSVGTGIGSGLSFIIALFLINTGLRRLENNTNIPPLFKGTPAVFLYVAMLSIAFAGLSGRSLFA
ncbi:MAG: hypothetical protein IJB86_03325 [Clostridia bacterium]|nr:hypothetical protein [Clostridia bacterium]